MKNFLLTLFAFVSLLSFGQEFKLGKVLMEELKQDVHKLDPAAPAAILYKRGTTMFDFDKYGNWEVVTEVSVRLKIYKKDGYGFATVDVPITKIGDDSEQVEFFDAVTYNLEDGKIVKSKLQDKGKLTDGAKSVPTSVKITMPNVKEGSVIEYRYIVKSPFFTRLPKWYFQYTVPVNSIEYGLYIPQYFTYNRMLSAYIPVTEKIEIKKRTHTHGNSNPRGESNTANSAVQNVDGSIVFNETIKTYTAANVPALRDNGYVDNIKNYQSVVTHELASTHFPNTGRKDYAMTWETLAELVYNEEGFGNELARAGYFEKDLELLIAGDKNKDELIAAIFGHVRDHMSWNGEYSYTSSEKLNNAYEQKSGNSAEINLMLIAMLRYAGFTVNPVLLSTRENGLVSYVNRSEFNYVVAGLESQKGIQLLDATSKNAVPGILPLRALNSTGRIIRENFSSAEVDLMPLANSVKSTTVSAVISQDGVVNGKIKAYYSDYNAYQYREGTNDKNSKDLTTSEVKIADKDLGKPVVEEFVYTSNELTEAGNGRLIVSPMLMFAATQNPFTDATRTYPVDFVFPRQDKYTFSISLPKGYAIESLPESATYQMKDNVGSFRFNISAVGQGQIQVVVVNNINYAMIGPDYYPALKEFYGTVIKKQSEKIVLKKL